MSITASLVKELRERTGAGMMECKKALVETNGDIESAIENMRKSGQAKAAKKAGRTAADGVIIVKIDAEGRLGVILEVNCETDFVAKDENFKSFADAVAERALKSDVSKVEELLDMSLHDGEETTIEEARQALISKIGENMNVRRFERISSNDLLAHYQHGVRIGVLVDIAGDVGLGHDIAMHIAASNPVCINTADVDSELISKEKEIVESQARESGKPENIIEKMVEGRMSKFLTEITLLGQKFVKNPDISVGELVKENNVTVKKFIRYEIGEGIQKKSENFADEVAAQAAAARGD